MTLMIIFCKKIKHPSGRLGRLNLPIKHPSGRLGRLNLPIKHPSGRLGRLNLPVKPGFLILVMVSILLQLLLTLLYKNIKIVILLLITTSAMDRFNTNWRYMKIGGIIPISTSYFRLPSTISYKGS